MAPISERETQQIEVVTKVFRNLTPSAASRSMFGVLSSGWPAQPRQSARWSSVIRSRKLGFLAGSAAPAWAAMHAIATAASRIVRTIGVLS